ncbi:unnamed protein product [Meganyctiphanes norvegica]|uniref:Uncharacterized protein n=1 Tax=Meganyctiphanes norvegica TaxID=48144 RepID=A0AAV2QWM3_MEGNR
MSWLWVDLRPVDLFTPLWHCTAPAYDFAANCAALTSAVDIADRVTLWDGNCDVPMYFICEMNVHLKGYDPVEEEEEEKRMWADAEDEDHGSLLGDLVEENFAAFQETDYVI